MPTYAEQLTELEQIVEKLQSADCDIDSMVSLTRRATELIEALRTRLTATDDELRAILARLQPANS